MPGTVDLVKNAKTNFGAFIFLFFMNSIKETLGSGQFSTVNRAEWFNCDTGTEVAVKQLKLTDSESKVKLLQEAAIMAQFNHSNVLKLHGIVTDSATVRI